MRNKLVSTLGLAVVLVLGTQAAGAASDGECHSTGTGLDAHFINETPDSQLDVSCDVGVYFNQDGAIDGVDIHGTSDGARSVQYGILVDAGADVTVTDSAVTVDPDYPNQFLSITYRDGAAGTVDGNDLSGAHRVGVLLDDGADATVKNNTIEGTGPKDEGWAENGIQVSRGATGTVTDNTISNHWWDKDNFLSSGVIVFDSDDVTVNHNVVRDNDLGVFLSGDRNNAVRNTISVTEVADVLHYGVLISGDNNGVRQNTIEARTGTAGVYIFGGSTNTKLIRNDITGWAHPVVDQGDETKQPVPFNE